MDQDQGEIIPQNFRELILNKHTPLLSRCTDKFVYLTASKHSYESNQQFSCWRKALNLSVSCRSGFDSRRDLAILYFVDRACRHKFLLITSLTHFFMYLFISSLYVFRASPCSSSGYRIVLIHYLVWLVCVSDCLVCWSGGNCSSLLTAEQDQDVPSWSCLKAVYKPVWHTPLTSVQWINSWWWTEELSETCRVSCQNKLVKLVHLAGFIIKKKNFQLCFELEWWISPSALEMHTDSHVTSLSRLFNISQK